MDDFVISYGIKARAYISTLHIIINIFISLDFSYILYVIIYHVKYHHVIEDTRIR